MAIIPIIFALGCGHSGPASSSSGSSGGGATAGYSSSGGTGAGSGSSAGSSNGGSASGGTTGSLQPCAPDAVWVGDLCVQTACSGKPIGAPCLLEDGGLGICAAGSCHDIDLSNDPNNCGAYGAICPDGGCTNGVCNNGCDPGCPAGTTCSNLGNASCFVSTCDASSNDRICSVTLDAGGFFTGFCCEAACIAP
ncbi:MAG: hypothetical protein ACYDCL_23175, partial [Myxococcales bacterium]